MYGIVTVSVLYQGKPLGKKYFDEHPEIHNLYPSVNDFNTKYYMPVLKEAQQKMSHIMLVVSENSVKADGVEIKA